MRSSAVLVFITLLAYSTQRDICKYYDKFEEQKKCGPDGYLMHYGKRNCMNFNKKETKSMFDHAGRVFIKCTTQCLVEFMNDLIQRQPNISCDEIKDEAFKSHVTCYLDCDFCEVCKTNKKALFHTYYFKDFFSTKAISQVFDIIAKCGLFSCFSS